MNYPKVYHDTMEEIKTLVDEQITQGITLLPTDYDHDKGRYVTSLLTHQGSMSKFLRHIAKEMKRPYIKATESYNGAIEVIIPKAKYLQPVMAPLLLIGEPGLRHTREPVKPAVWFISGRSVTTFYMQNSDIFFHWREGIANDPICRKALRLEVTDAKS